MAGTRHRNGTEGGELDKYEYQLVDCQDTELVVESNVLGRKGWRFIAFLPS